MFDQFRRLRPLASVLSCFGSNWLYYYLAQDNRGLPTNHWIWPYPSGINEQCYFSDFRLKKMNFGFFFKVWQGVCAIFFAKRRNYHRIVLCRFSFQTVNGVIPRRHQLPTAMGWVFPGGGAVWDKGMDSGKHALLGVVKGTFEVRWKSGAPKIHHHKGQLPAPFLDPEVFCSVAYFLITAPGIASSVSQLVCGGIRSFRLLFPDVAPL